MEKDNRMVSKEKGNFICNSRFFCFSRYWSIDWLVVLGVCCLVGCTTIKKAGITSLAAGTGALAGIALSGGVTAPILGATTTAFVADVITEAVPIGATGRKAMNECAEDNFWTLLGQIIEMGGWLLILLVVVPMIVGWVLPGPLEKKKRS
ncbi:MAG: hypothetical protein QF704_14125 [Anaerolineales bacterium]|nr:hypothetical protein [Anaerolineales bacterium]